MKRILHPIPVITAMIVGLLTTMCISVPVVGYSKSYQETTVSSDSIIIYKQVSSRKHKIRLYADASHESLLFTVKGESGRVYQLFLFDYEGHLIKQANIRDRQTTILQKIEKGEYLFEIFSDDERIETGQVFVR